MPTYNENLEKVRKACIEANPEIVESKEEREKIEKILDNLNDRSGVNLCFDEEINKEMRMTLVEILGRPIRLSDVLLAIDKLPINDFKNNILFWTKVENLLGIKDAGMKDLLFYIFFNWKLPQDDLSLQSPETVEFIAKLL